MVDGKGGLRQHWRGLFRLAALAAVAVSTAVVVHLLLFDVVYGNPHRTLRETILTLLVTTPIAALSIFLGVLLVFALPHWFQATILGCLVRRLGRWSYAAVLLALPITTVIAWYSYDYLVPSYRLCCLGDSIDSQPYGHGLTNARYVNMLAFQVIATSFTLVWLDASNRSRRRRTITELSALVVAVVAGGVMGWHLTQGQLDLVSEEKARSRQQALDGGVKALTHDPSSVLHCQEGDPAPSAANSDTILGCAH
jgi:hypothetical protein